jgi:hypothetical protein
MEAADENTRKTSVRDLRRLSPTNFDERSAARLLSRGVGAAAQLNACARLAD